MSTENPIEIVYIMHFDWLSNIDMIPLGSVTKF